METTADTTARPTVHIIRIAGIGNPNIRISTVGCPRRSFHHSRNGIRHIAHQHLFSDRIFRSEKLAGQRIRNDHTRQAGNEIRLRKRFAGNEAEIKDLRKEYGIRAAYKMVDTCAAEFAAATPYYYSVYGDEQTENEAVETKDKKKILVLGSGPIRIGQGIEFDFCSVHCTWAFAKEGYETIIINNNPETVSTDFDIADKLYFEPLTPEDVESIVDIEKPDGAVVQFGGQTAI